MTQLALDLIAENKAKHKRGEDASYLDLGNCGLTELPDLSGMDWVETLILSSEWWEFDLAERQPFESNSQNRGGQNRIEKIHPSHSNLPMLKKLVANNVSISDGRFLENLTSLTFLDLSDNQISDGRFLENLTSITFLDLGNNQISDGRFLENLTSLTGLGLNENQISDWCFLENLTSLILLGLSENQISDGRFLEKLTSLILLNLGSNQISDWRFLEKLTSLILLDLSYNQISDISFLEKLTALNTLHLSYNQISDISFLEKLTGLNTLDLSSNQISDGRFLEKLTELNTLDLSYNKISDWRFLEKLTELNTLDLSYNKISDISFLEKLTELNTLNLSSNQISDISFLEKLTALNTLNLSSNQISDWGFLEKLTELNTLNLSYNQISNISFLEKLTTLNTLNLSSNQISDAHFLEKLTKLTSLNLGSNQILDWRFLEKLTKLTTLGLNCNQISNARFLEKLTTLTNLNLGFNQISDWRFLEKLTRLTTLNLSSNQISDARFLEKLTALTTLNLSSNQISDARFLEKLARLNTLNLRHNQISDLEALLLILKKGVPVNLKEYGGVGINLHNNPLTTPPIEIVKQGNAAILEYFRQKEKAGIKPLLEAKMLLLGDGRAGKTSLACRMLGKELPRQEDRTQGVDIVIGEYSFPVEEGEFVLHIWDFAGQDKYKPLHQFFYTEGAVYVMVADSGNAQTDFADWFETAEMFGGEGSPLLVALNEFREGMGIGTFDEEKWRKQFPKLIKEVRLVNLLSQKGFPELEKDIRHLANQLPHTRTEYPANWANIRSELDRRRNENYISLPEYLNICRQFDLPERESALILSGILHRIGVCLHYQKNELLRLHVILKNEWATAAVYKILEDRTVAEEKKGFFDWSDLRRIWSDDSYQDMQPQLLALMCEFKMAYPLPKPNEFVTPPLLPPAPPQDWDFPAAEAIEVRVEYEFLPKALMTQFIVSRHPDIDRGRTLVWREGVVLRWSADTLAQVSKIKSRGRDALQIQALGSERRGLLTAILKTLRDLHDEYRGIRAHEIVPCPCEGCRTEKNPQHYFDFKNLSNRLEKGRRVVECDQSLEEVDLLKILGDLLLFERLGVGEAVVLAKSEKPAPNSVLTAQMVSTIREKLKKDKLEEALAYLETHAPTESILLQAQITRSAKNTQQGLDGLEQESAIRQRTIRAVLAWLENA